MIKNYLAVLIACSAVITIVEARWQSDDPFHGDGNVEKAYVDQHNNGMDDDDDDEHDHHHHRVIDSSASVERVHDLWMSSAANRDGGSSAEGDLSAASDFDDYADMATGEDDMPWNADPTVLLRFRKVGQIAALEFNSTDKRLVIFHRGSAVWDKNTFTKNGTFANARVGPIRDDTILFYNTQNGNILKTAGRNLFYLPHGLSLGHHGAIWITDVGLHQVFKLKPTPYAPFLESELILGEAFQPGDDDRHFCKPTSAVEALSDGSVFVADGYCNARIMKFNAKTGALLAKFGKQTPPPQQWNEAPLPGTFFVPHALALIEHKDMICVADRENQRIQCFVAGLRNNSHTGRFIAEISHSEFRDIYALKYAKKSNILLALSRDPYSTDQKLSNKIFLIDAESGKPFEAISIPGLVNGHDLAVDDGDDGMVIYVSEIGPNQIWRLSKSG